MARQSAAAGPPPDRDGGGVRVLIVDDSVVARAVLGRMIEGMGRFRIAGSVSDVTSALAFLANDRADVILLDLEMPGIHGLTALPDLVAAGQGAKILVVSSAADDGAAAAVQALALGAADTLVKPGVGNFAGRFAAVLEDRLTRLFDADDAAASVSAHADRAPGEFDIVAVGASTGGIHALSQMLRAIPQSFQPPILVTQHLPASFMSYFAAQLAVLAGRPCEVAADHMRVRPGRMLVAPGMPHTTELALSCTMMLPPVSISRRAPTAPSRPMPDRITPSPRAPNRSAIESSIGSTEGMQPLATDSCDRRTA